jgi:opacity protein-like surface antigen
MNRKLVAALLVSFAGLTLDAHADETAAPKKPGKFYVGVEAGQSTADADATPFFFSSAPDTPNTHNGRATGYKIRFGFQFIRYLAAEVGYMDFGSVDIDDVQYDCPSSRTPPCTYDINAKLHGPLISAVGTLPMGERWGLVARVGWLHASGITTVEDPRDPSSRERLSDGNIGFNVGLGLRYKVNDRLDAELNWERSDQLGFGLSLSGGAAVFNFGSAKLASLGIRYFF